MDHIRFTLDDEEHAEFAWFASEYPRVFRYHLQHAGHRLTLIHKAYQVSHSDFEKKLLADNKDYIEIATFNKIAYQMWWDFEAYLNAISSALDIFARIVGLFYNSELPLSSNRLYATKDVAGVVTTMRAAQERWVTRLKDYRDCFTHYTPVDNMASIRCLNYEDGFEVRANLPTNPNIRENIGFQYSRRVEVLTYASTVYKHIKALNRKVGAEIHRALKNGQFPMRTENLFFKGRRRQGVQ